MDQSFYPRPMLRRGAWQSLNGVWQFAFDEAQRWKRPQEVVWDREITVPYPPESRASGLHDEDFHLVSWYRCRVTPEVVGECLVLHFGAVDYQATVWVNGQMVAEHQGGHTPFSADLSAVYTPGEELEIVVRAFDDPHDLSQPRGKQAWEREPHDIWYPRTSGIWQTVWLEARPATHLSSLVWTASVERWEIALGARIQGPLPDGLRLRVRLEADGQLLTDDDYAVTQNRLERTLSLQDGGIDAVRHLTMWTPEHPQLIEATLELHCGGEVIDRVSSYTAMRSVAVDHQRFLLNGRPYYLKLVLDQGYWPDSLLAASDEELRRDVELIRLLGFNGARKHQKIENPRWLFWCDVLGLMVWEELPSTYAFSTESARRLTQEWTEAIERDRSHPCIVAWVPINESWGVPDLPLVAAQRNFVRSLYYLTKTLDPTRPVIGNDGWEYVVTDIIAIHDYTDKPKKLRKRYGSRAALEHTLAQDRPLSRLINLDAAALLPGGPAHPHPAMLTEFGGIAFAPGEATGWGYSRRNDPEGLTEEYTTLMNAVHKCGGLSGFCYTQLTDTFLEINGLLFADRTPKTDLAALAVANRGKTSSMVLERDPDQDPMGYDRFWKKKLAQRALNQALPSAVSTDD
jgi:beta-galactosidase/beta-glucuronidase